MLIIITRVTERTLSFIRVSTYTLYTTHHWAQGKRCTAFVLISLLTFPSFALLLLLLSGSIETALLLQTLSIPENEMNRMHYIPLGRDVEQGDLPTFFFFLQMISNQGKKSLSAVKLLVIRVFLVSAHWKKTAETVTGNQWRKKNTEDIWLSMCSLSPIFLFPTCHGWLSQEHV